MKSISNFYLISIYIVCVFFLTNAKATNGVVEINHTCATQLRCFSGDNDIGYPVNIDGSAGTSYRLTSDLIIPSENVTGINIFASNITIDLNGFTIIRSGCEDNCTHLQGGGTGIRTNASADGVTVKNGKIIGMGHIGLSVGKNATVQNIGSFWNAKYGIFARSGSSISDVNASYNNAAGIFYFGDDGIIQNSAMNNNKAYGLVAHKRMIIRGNNVSNNDGHGIIALDGSLVSNNNASKNTEVGLGLAPTVVYKGNVMVENIEAAVVSGVNLGDNFCDTDTTCP